MSWDDLMNVLTTMPDLCHDHCEQNFLDDVPSVYYPYRWRDGIAAYQCKRGHTWTCSWGHHDSGDAPQYRGVDQNQVGR